MRRRAFIARLGSAAAWPLVARAQQREQTRRIGVLIVNSESDPEVMTWLTSFQQGLQRLGWEQGRNIQIEYRSAGGDQRRLQAAAAELVRMAPDVLFAAATPAMVALNRETRVLPIVFVQVSDPVILGFVASLARPGRNITGFTTFEHPIASKWLELLEDTAPGRKRVAVIVDPDGASQFTYLQAIEAAAPSFKVQLNRADVRDPVEIEHAFNKFAEQPSGALLVLPNAAPFVTVTSSSPWRRGMAFRRCIRVGSLPPAAALFRTELICPTSTGKRRPMSIAS
jgi:putative ABC transport system substrate-binding protein